MASRRKRNQRDRSNPPRESDEPSTWEDLLAQERERRTGRAPDDFDYVPVDGQGVTR